MSQSLTGKKKGEEGIYVLYRQVDINNHAYLFHFRNCSVLVSIDITYISIDKAFHSGTTCSTPMFPSHIFSQGYPSFSKFTSLRA